MKKMAKKLGLDFEVDKLTNSIENVVTGDSFATDITLISMADLKTVSKKNGWQFDWKQELKQPEKDVYKLTIVNNQSVIQGLISLEIKSDHVYMHLVESAPFNKGKTKIYAGVPGNLVAFACKLAFYITSVAQKLSQTNLNTRCFNGVTKGHSKFQIS